MMWGKRAAKMEQQRVVGARRGILPASSGGGAMMLTASGKTFARPLLLLVLLMLAGVAEADDVGHRGIPDPLRPLLDALYDELVENLQRPDSLVSARCRNHTMEYLENVQSGTLWALKMYDSTGKPTSGILTGGISFLGYFSECLASFRKDDNNYTSTEVPVDFTSRYCHINIQINNSSPQNLSHFIWNKFKNKQSKVGLCVPSTCSETDIGILFNKTLSSVIPDTAVMSTTCYPYLESFEEDPKAVGILVLLLVFVALVLIGTIFDIISKCRVNRKQLSSVPSISQSVTNTTASSEGLVNNNRDIEDYDSRLTKVLRSFSFISNGSKILNTGGTKEAIQVLHGIRFLSMAWIILGHSYSFAQQWLVYRNEDDLTVIPDDVISQAIANGTLSVDTFLFISGLLLVYLSLAQMQKTNGNINLVQFYLHRYFRMTPLMMAVIAICATILPYLGTGPSWKAAVSTYDETCRKNWWINALYLQNFIDRTNMCLNHTWYSAVDFQFYIISPIILYLLYRNTRWGIALLVILFIASATTTAAIIAANDFPAMPYLSTNLVPADVLNDYSGYVYIKPYCRIGPYLIGMVAGFIIRSTKGSFVLKKRYVFLGWFSCALFMLTALYAMWSANAGLNRPARWVEALYGAFGRSLWAFGLLWIVIACLAGYGGFINTLLSWNAFIPLSRLTFCAYIIHPVLMAIFYGSRENVFDFSGYMLVYFTIGNMVITYGVSFLISLLFEAPVIGLEKALLGRR